jgi:dipeptidyl aminopeptidase/acylaminoacyl peptidase
VCGLDSCKEETGAYEAPFLARGIATLAFDGPGQGEAEDDFAIRGNYETAVKAVVDSIETRPDVDSSRIGLWGVSLGGYYAPRAAAFEPRLKACIALSGPYDFGAAWDGLPELTREAFRVRSHCATQADAKRNAATLTLEGVASRIACPMFIVTGKLDRVVPWRDAERLAREVKGPCELLVIEDGGHVANNRGYRWRPQSADWMAERLGAG